MRKRLKNFRAKNQTPQQLIDEATYREHGAAVYRNRRYDSRYSGWSNPSRPLGQTITLRHLGGEGTGPSAPSGPT